MTVMEYGQQNRDVIMLLPGLRHGDLSINHPARYVRMLTERIGEAL